MAAQHDILNNGHARTIFGGATGEGTISTQDQPPPRPRGETNLLPWLRYFAVDACGAVDGARRHKELYDVLAERVFPMMYRASLRMCLMCLEHICESLCYWESKGVVFSPMLLTLVGNLGIYHQSMMFDGQQ